MVLKKLAASQTQLCRNYGRVANVFAIDKYVVYEVVLYHTSLLCRAVGSNLHATDVKDFVYIIHAR